MTLSDFIDRLAAELDMRPKDLELYARRLREARLLPERRGGRRVGVTSQDGATLILAVLAATSAADAPLAAAQYEKLRLAKQVGAIRQLSKITSLRDLIERGLELSHRNQTVAGIFTDGVLVVQRDQHFAEFAYDLGNGTNPLKLTFRPARSPNAPPRPIHDHQPPFRVAAYLQTRVFVRLSIAMVSPADVMPA